MTSDRRFADTLIAAAIGSVTLAFYLLGAGRNYDYDSSQTVGTFIATPSLLDPFRRRTVFNNHPLLSFLDHLVYSAGGHSAAALRMLPILFGALAVAVVAWWATGLWGRLAGVSAATLLALNPLFAFSSRSVRGYSLVTLCVVCSTVLCARLLRREQRTTSGVYVIAAAAGIATHLFALLPLVAQIGVVVARRAFNRRWAARFAAALVLGGLAYVQIGAGMIESVRREARHFRPHFPVALAQSLLGGTGVAIAATSVLLVLGAATLRRRELVAAAATVGAAVAALWLALQPFDLFPRFLVWLVAAVALIAGAAVGRRPAAALLVVVAAVALIVVDARGWTENPLPDRQAAQLIGDVRARGNRACVLPLVRGSLLAYISAPREITRARNLERCDFVVGVLADPPALRRAARHELPHDWTLAAETPYLVYSRFTRSELNPTGPSRRSS